jgi:hypothetical protein
MPHVHPRILSLVLLALTACPDNRDEGTNDPILPEPSIDAARSPAEFAFDDLATRSGSPTFGAVHGDLPLVTALDIPLRSDWEEDPFAAVAAALVDHAAWFQVPEDPAVEVVPLIVRERGGFVRIDAGLRLHGLPVPGGGWSALLSDGHLLRISQRRAPLRVAATQPTLTADEARSIAADAAGGVADVPLPARLTWWAAPGDDTLRLAWLVEVVGEPVDGRGVAVVDATDGSVRELQTRVNSGTGDVDYEVWECCDTLLSSRDCQLYRTEDGVDDPFASICPTSTSDDDNEADDAALFMNDWWAWADRALGRCGFDGCCGEAPAFVDVTFPLGPNASHDDGKIYFSNGFVLRDVFGHEAFHAVVHAEGGLNYKVGSGALNESFADVFAEIFEGDLTDRWNYHTLPGGGATRNLAQPALYGQPDHVDAAVSTPGNGGVATSGLNFGGWNDRNANGLPDEPGAQWCASTGANDRCGVHSNSGIPNKVAQLIIDGGVHHGVQVRGIGTPPATPLLYRTMQNLPQDATFLDYAVTLRQIAGPDQMGRGTPGMACATDNALASVGLLPWYADADCDGRLDSAETDDDGDGVPDASDNCRGVYNPTQMNMGGAALGDACDPDVDGDLVPNIHDNCPRASNALQTDSDGNNVGDDCQDTDGDGTIDIFDNCPRTGNRDQANADGDDLGDACDPDRDGDFLDNGIDLCPDHNDLFNLDSDRDGVGDVCDNCRRDANAEQIDCDVDGEGIVCDDEGQYEAIYAETGGCIPDAPVLVVHPSRFVQLDGCPTCGTWLRENWTVRVSVAMPEGWSEQVRLVDEAGNTLARADGGPNVTLRFEPAAGTWRAPPSGLADGPRVFLDLGADASMTTMAVQLEPAELVAPGR